MNSFEKAVVGEIPTGYASEYFLKLKYGSAGGKRGFNEVLSDFASLPQNIQDEICKEAGVDKHLGEAVRDMAEKKPNIDAETNAYQSGIKSSSVKTASAEKKGFAERVLPGTERYHSSRMLEMLNNLPARMYTPEAAEEKYASAFKLALEQSPDIKAYLANEQQGMQAQEQAEGQFMQQKMQQMQQQMASSEAGQAASQQQMQQLTEQIAQSQQQIQLAQESAMQAQSLASQAQQGQMGATDEAMRNAQLAAQMRIAYQQLRSQMMEIASSDPAQAIGDQLKGQMPGTPGLGPEAMGQQAPTSGPATPESGPAGQAAGAQAAPGAAPPEGENAANNANSTGQSPGAPRETASPTLEVGIKKANDQLMGALGGAALGGIGTALEARAGSGKLRNKVEGLEAQGGGFIHALNLAQAKARLALSEATEAHPVAATLMGSVMGAGMGSEAAPHIRNIMGK